MDSYAAIRTKIENLVRLAERPGTPAEGDVARDAAVRLSLKYGIPCKFTTRQRSSASSGSYTYTRTTSAPPRPSQPPPRPKLTPDQMFQLWIESLKKWKWNLVSCEDTKIGRCAKFRNPESKSEIRVTQRKGPGSDFEAEHVMRPDPVEGYDMSYTAYMTIHLEEMMHHLGANFSRPWYSRW